MAHENQMKVQFVWNGRPEQIPAIGSRFKMSVLEDLLGGKI